MYKVYLLALKREYLAPLEATSTNKTKKIIENESGCLVAHKYSYFRTTSVTKL